MISAGIIWIALCILAGVIGSKRKIGGAAGFFLSLFLSPLVGLIAVFASDRKVEAKQYSPTFLKLIREGDTLFINKKQYDAAISKYEEALKYSDEAPKTNFKLAKLYSLTGDTDSSLKYLSASIDEGYSNYDRINKDEELNNLRETHQYKMFVDNKYKLPIIEVVKERDTKPKKTDELEKLFALKEKGALTDEEFQIEKRKILDK